MELLDRYLQAVQKHLPWKGQADIVAELRGNLEAQLEDKESELGRGLTSAEAEAWLKQLGSPGKMAARYQPQQYLIGPALFPTYKIVLRLVLTWTLIIYSILSLVQIVSTATPSEGSVLEVVGKIPGVLFTAVVWVTINFVIFEILCAHIPQLAALSSLSNKHEWEPSKLPALETPGLDGRKPRSFSNALAEVIFGYIFLIWLLLVPGNPYLLIGPGVYFLHLEHVLWSPVLPAVYWSVVALNAIQLAWNTVQLIRGRWQRQVRIERIVINVLGAIPIVLALSVPGHVYVWLKNPAVDQAQFGALVSLFNEWFYKGALILGGIVVLELLWGVGRMIVAQYRKRSVAMV